MAKTSLKVKQQRKPSIRLGLTQDAEYAADRTLF